MYNMKLLYLIIVVLSACSVKAQSGSHFLKTNADENTLLWEVSGNGLTTSSYLLGTFHLLCKDDIHLSLSLKQAIANSAAIYLELDLDDPATLFGSIKLMQMKEGKTLKELYTPEEFNRVSNYFIDSLKTPIGLFQTMKPAFLVALLYPKMMPCHTVSSVEEDIMALAKADKKEIRGLETIAFQAALFNGIPYDKQAKELLNAIDSMEKSKIYFGLMLSAYKNQQLAEIEKIINDPEFGHVENQSILLDERNKNWVMQCHSIMKNEAVFIAVGAGHLIGKKGLIALLRAEGYQLRPLENK